LRAIDIETIPNPAMIERLPEPEVALGNTKNPELIKEKIAEAKKKQVEKMGLSPFYGRICSFSWCGLQEDKGFKTIPEISDAAEIELINKIIETLVVGQPQTNLLITWNGFTFDFPYIYKRAALLKIALPQRCPGLRYWTRKYTQEPHCDLMQELCGWGATPATNLDEAGKLFLGRGKTQRDYSTYADLITKGEGDKIGLDNLCDTELTFDLYNTLSPYLF
jgi:DNA polymerase elongation subunit (family B)